MAHGAGPAWEPDMPRTKAASSADGGPQPTAPSLSLQAATAAALTMSSCLPGRALYDLRVNLQPTLEE
jgi:hypothetical protein